jgi:hypothetical protein
MARRLSRLGYEYSPAAFPGGVQLASNCHPRRAAGKHQFSRVTVDDSPIHKLRATMEEIITCRRVHTL